MRDVVLINPYWQRRDSNIAKKISGCLPNIGVTYLASSLEKAGLRVGIIDANAEQLNDDQVLARLQQDMPGFVGMSSTSVNVNRALKLAGRIKDIEKDCKVVFGGVHATAVPDEVIGNPRVDFIFQGEAELHLHRLVKGEDLSSIDNLSYKENNRIVHNGQTENRQPLDSLPLPAYHLIPVHLYRPSLGNYKRLPGMPIISSRGCPGKCTFCFVGVNGKRIRFRSAENVIREIRLLVERYGMREISFYDDNFTTSGKRVGEICEGILSRGLDITWTCSSRVDLINEKMLKIMRRSGCHQIGFGIESGDEQILATIRKRIKLDKALESIRLTQKCGIQAKINLMFGNPGETVESLQKTLDFALKSKADGFIISIATPYPGTELYRWANENGYLTSTNWDEYDSAQGVINLPTVDRETLRRFYVLAHRKLYLQPSYLAKRLWNIRSLEDIKKNYLAFRAVTGLT